MPNAFYWIAAALLLGILILVHELGHFWVARRCGIKVMSFGIGFGPKLLSHTAKSGITYVLRLLPLGGYCRYYGEDETVENESDAFYRQPVWKRAVSTFAGPAMNFIAAIVALFILYAFLGLATGVLPIVDYIDPAGPAYEAGLRSGDDITHVNGAAIDTSEQVRTAIMSTADGGIIQFTVERGGLPVDIAVVPRVLDEAAGVPQIGIRFKQVFTTLGLVDSARYAVTSTFATIGEMGRFVQNIITRQQDVSGLVGPIGTVKMVREETESGGIRRYLSMAALISINLGFINMLPIPGLDGSRLLFLLIEKIRNKRMDPNKEGIVHLIGIALLLLLMLPVYINDVRGLFGI